MFGKKTLADIQSSFTQAVKDLSSLIEDNTQEVERNINEVARLNHVSNLLLDENDKAGKFKQNLENLLS